MSYGSIDGGSFGGRNPFGGPMRQGYQPVGKAHIDFFIQQTNKVITSTSQLIKQLSDIISGSSRQDRLRLTRLKTELSESVQRYGDLQKKIAERSKALLPPAQKDKKKSPQTPLAEQNEEGPLFGEEAASDGGVQAFLSEISEEDVEVLRQREEALLQIEILGWKDYYINISSQQENVDRRLRFLAHFHLSFCRNC
uniref:Syntaxin N-terminal domain-containing protein n=1 Tax=Sphaeramia orbicularis TaxID=375764 RepID=A0A673BR28_9TELE